MHNLTRWQFAYFLIISAIQLSFPVSFKWKERLSVLIEFLARPKQGGLHSHSTEAGIDL